ncbi:YdiU family protein [Phormidium yuhuli AB48]|uniref:Protein nucleotidyltransferase YdiU n=1 Tax=Phormidium yuhuli AB48 TaxID=2940671 RepID=A0ABY5AND3_9CYAN|nr:YdiU family protein [Phormidium yuhuli]USR90692.1 YdiU family protein [Phormidium yuhuli AB48]
MTVPESSQSPVSQNPFLSLEYETALESLGDDYYDIVEAADFPTHILRFRGDRLLPKLGLDPNQVSDNHFIESFGKFSSSRPFLALRYHGYQFGEYNPRLGDGRGFLYGQVRGTDGKLYDFGTKGSGSTPYSRGGDGRLTLKGGVREIIASETLARLGVNTSRCLSVIETGEQLWRGDEPSPTRSCVMVRLSQSHIRFGTFERLHYLRRKDLSKTLLDHVLEVYYPHIDRQQPQAYLQFYRELVDRTAQLAAQWMVAGFCHAVLNTDNMSITGESFDYGPYAFIPSYDPNFTAAYFDYYGRYSYGNQPLVCKLNLELLQQPLSGVTPDLTPEAMTEALQEFDRSYETAYRQGMLRRLGLPNLGEDDGRELVQLTVDILRDNDIGYHDFFSQLRQQFSPQWRDDPEAIFPKADPPHILQPWIALYHRFLQTHSPSELEQIQAHLAAVNPNLIPIRPEIEAIWEPITQADNWQPLYDLLDRIWD